MPRSTGNEKDPREALLAHFAARLRRESRFVAFLLDRFARGHDLTFGEMAAVLGCDAPRLTRLAMCLRPRGGDRAFRRQVRELAQFCVVDEERLYSVLKEACDCKEAVIMGACDYGSV